MQDIDLESMIEGKWFSLSEDEQGLHRTVFIELLRLPYHRKYFSRLPVSRLIGERWFKQYLQSIFFDEHDG